ncbi:PREDICTED: uncharacterized protein LOC109153215 isoform X2 [Ipomoea nil]|uniref:uncharacterized protein LOC109153215 isoform X2 n=1 Tax=Ipomoea nil TaxID=35883 RepID=UPI000901C2B5|nr:PREDICTED: uncharacterized protein LOC109153215 isoform X2 [Ipomoea nil]
MKFLGCFSVLFLVAGAASICIVCSSKDLAWRGNDMPSTPINNRKLKDASAYDGDGGKAYTDDYGPIDPVPSSKASVKPGPIQHGTPLMPYIPIPSPPPSSSSFFGVP